MIYQVGIVVLQYLAVCSNSAIRFGRRVNEIRPSGFYLFGCPDLAVRIWPSVPDSNILHLAKKYRKDDYSGHLVYSAVGTP